MLVDPLFNYVVRGCRLITDFFNNDLTQVSLGHLRVMHPFIFHGSVKLLVQVSLALQNLFLCTLFLLNKFYLFHCVVLFEARVDVSNLDAAGDLLNLVWLSYNHRLTIRIINLAYPKDVRVPDLVFIIFFLLPDVLIRLFFIRKNHSIAFLLEAFDRFWAHFIFVS